MPMLTIGVIRGTTIELEQRPNLADGQRVTVAIEAIPNAASATVTGGVPPLESWSDRLIIDPAILPGERIVQGTRLAAEDLVAELTQDRDAAALLQAHPELTPADVSALEHYARTPISLRRSFGVWADGENETDDFLTWNRQRRQRKRRDLEP